MIFKQKKCCPIFVVGNSSSGTTMMGRILDQTKDIYTFHEIHFFEELVAPEDFKKKISRKEALKLLSILISIERQGYLSKRTPEVFNNESQEFLNKQRIDDSTTPVDIFYAYLNYECNRNGKTIPCDQTPRNLYYISEILENFPEARIINMIRDPRDVLLSQKNKWKRRFLGAKNIPLTEALRSWINYHPIVICKLWNSSIKTIECYINYLNVKNVYYEELVLQPNKTLKDICNFLQIDYQKEMLDIPKIGSSSNKDEFSKSGIRKDRVHAWKRGGLSETELYISQKICKTTMREHNYSIKSVRQNTIKYLIFYLFLPIRLSISFMVNIRRYRNISDSIKRRFAS